jgi:hypothetical protein
MVFTDEHWAAIWKAAEAKAGTIPGPGVHGIVGRSITKACGVVVRLWGKYEAVLRPHMTTLAIAALDALVAAILDINAVNPPGPQ